MSSPILATLPLPLSLGTSAMARCAETLPRGQLATRTVSQQGLCSWWRPSHYQEQSHASQIGVIRWIKLGECSQYWQIIISHQDLLGTRAKTTVCLLWLSQWVLKFNTGDIVALFINGLPYSQQILRFYLILLRRRILFRFWNSTLRHWCNIYLWPVIFPPDSQSSFISYY